MLTPENLAVISQKSGDLAAIASSLARVPAFMVTIGNSSTPISVVNSDGGRLAYFFLEYQDAEIFRRRLLQQQKQPIAAQVAALSLADVILAYTSEAALEAKENFVVVPTMQTVVSARKLLTAQVLWLYLHVY